ncbi:hypothetical protein [Kordia sp.]|uniref:hypothetical protein n=1 Tax=Kordia sp. TaxID=1965332 RepID=UPI003D2E9B9D
MRKNNFKLNLKKQVVSKLNERKIIGGRQDISEIETCLWSDLICIKTDKCFSADNNCPSADYQCPWSGPNSQ